MDAFSGPGSNQDKPTCSKQEVAPELQMSFSIDQDSTSPFLFRHSHSAQSLPRLPENSL